MVLIQALVRFVGENGRMRSSKGAGRGLDLLSGNAKGAHGIPVDGSGEDQGCFYSRDRNLRSAEQVYASITCPVLLGGKPTGINAHCRISPTWVQEAIG